MLCARPHWSNRYYVFLVLLFLLCAHDVPGASETSNNLFSRVSGLPGVYVKVIEALPGFVESLELAVVQPVDHDNPTGPKFTQRVFISHVGYERPVVIQTDGYAVPWHKKTELAGLLGANQVLVEHRYFGASIPEPRDLKYLTVWQSASDHHRLIELLRSIYPEKWISTGKSKGGQGAYFHRSFFPDDVDVTVSYVAPMMFSREDPRILMAVKNELGAETIERCEKLQVSLLMNREHVLPRISRTIDPGDLFLELELFFEFTVLNLPFDLFLMSDSTRPAVPDDSKLEETIDFYLELVDLEAYRARNRNTQSTLHYQTATEIGFFNYPRDHLRRHLRHGDKLDCSVLADSGSVPAFDDLAMKSILRKLEAANPNMILIYGERDLWTSARLDAAAMTNTLSIVHEGAAHHVRIADLTNGEKESIYTRLQEWLGIRVSATDRRSSN